jgi:hypothetical protein
MKAKRDPDPVRKAEPVDPIVDLIDQAQAIHLEHQQGLISAWEAARRLQELASEAADQAA